MRCSGSSYRYVGDAWYRIVPPMQALDMAAWGAGGCLDGLIHHADHGSNCTAMVYTERIVELGAVPRSRQALISAEASRPGGGLAEEASVLGRGERALVVAERRDDYSALVML